MSESTLAPNLASIGEADVAALAQRAAWVDRTEAGVLRLSDVDRVDFLQRMTTNNIKALQPGQHVVTVLTSPTARIVFVFTVLARAGDLLLLPAPGQAAALARHLRGQIFFMDKVKVEDPRDQWARLRVVGPQAAQALAAVGVDAGSLAPGAWAAVDDTLILYQPEYDLPGYVVLLPPARAAEWQTRWRDHQILPAAPAAYLTRRVELGRPAPGHELVEEYNPLEAGLAWACAENKGCYTGQEIIARQITYDKVTKSLVGLRGEGPLTAGTEITVDGRSVGTVTSATHSPMLDAFIALAVVKRPHNTPGTGVTAGDTPAQVVALPFLTQ